MTNTALFLVLLLLVYTLAMYSSFRFVKLVSGLQHQRVKSNHIRMFSGITESAAAGGTPQQQGKKGKSKGASPISDVAQSSAQGIEEIRKVRISKMEECTKRGINPFAYTFAQTHKAADLQKNYAELPNGEEIADLEVAVSGRIMTRRVFGKLAFFTLQDDTGTIQLYLDKGRLDSSFDGVKDLTDAGDIIGAKGTLKRTEKVVASALLISYLVASLNCNYLRISYTGRTFHLRQRVDDAHKVTASPPR